MSKLPHWMQAALHFCTITGLAFWLIVIGDYLDKATK